MAETEVDAGFAELVVIEPVDGRKACEGCFLNDQDTTALGNCALISAVEVATSMSEKRLQIAKALLSANRPVRPRDLDIPFLLDDTAAAFRQRFSKVAQQLKSLPLLQGALTSTGRKGGTKYQVDVGILGAVCESLPPPILNNSSCIEATVTEGTKTKVLISNSRTNGKLAPKPHITSAQKDIVDKGWQDFANCLAVDPDLFFVERGGSTRKAKEVCTGCNVREDCLEYALGNGEKFGIWGGLSERERRRIKRQRALERHTTLDDEMSEPALAD